MEIGIIGMGDMGRMYTKYIGSAGYTLNVCDRPDPDVEAKLRKDYEGQANVIVHQDGYSVSRRSDLVIYSVETTNIGRLVEEYGRASKPGAIIAGQTSVKAPEIAAFEKFLPDDTHIVTCHSLHGPTVDPKTETMIVIRHRASDEAYARAQKVFSCLGSRMVEMSAEEHDRITADTQAATHLAFESMGTAWRNCKFFPWEDQSYVGGIDNVKVLLTMRIFASKWHVYAGLALQNPAAKLQAYQYAQSATELYKMMIQEEREAFTQRVKKAGEAVFGGRNKDLVLLPDNVLNEYGLGVIPAERRKPNSHLSLLAMVDCWYQLGLAPIEHLLCQTPLFRLRLGIAQYLYTNPEMLEETIECALSDKRIRGDDLEFVIAAKEWAALIQNEDERGYAAQFLRGKEFFGDRLREAFDRSQEMIARLRKIAG
eukprot:Clim_evm7s134 gene=Clim_evmTU7s134